MFIWDFMYNTHVQLIEGQDERDTGLSSMVDNCFDGKHRWDNNYSWIS